VDDDDNELDDPLELDELDESLEELDDDELELGELLLEEDEDGLERLLRLKDELLDDPLLDEGDDERLELGELLLEELGDEELLDELIDELLDILLDGLLLDDDESELLLDDEPLRHRAAERVRVAQRRQP
jgi:hypothetical protein